MVTSGPDLITGPAARQPDRHTRRLRQSHVSMFRSAGPDDLDVVLALQREYYAGEFYPHDEMEARRALSHLVESPSTGLVWLAEDGPEAFAYVVLTVGYSLEYRGADAFVDELFVRSSHRGRGVGRAALEVVEAECRRRGVRALHLEVELDKPEAFGLYRRFGFEERGRRLMTRLMGGVGPPSDPGLTP